MGVSRDTFYRYQEAKASGDIEALQHKNRRRTNFKNRVDEAIEQAVLAYALEQPAYSQVRVSNELRKRGSFVSASGVRSVWLCHNLAHFKQRLVALETHVAETGAVLTEAQVVALEKKRDDDIACGEIDTAHPGYLGSQDTFYVGTLKGVGRIYQDLYRHLQQSRHRQAVCDQNPDHLGRPGERSRAALLRRACGAGTAHPHRPRHRTRRKAGTARLPTVSGDERHRIHTHEDGVTADQRHLRAVSQNNSAGVLPGAFSQEALSRHR